MRNSTLWRGGILSLLLIGFAVSFASAQVRTVTGNVSSESEGPIPGVNIVIQGTVTGAVTDVDGDFSYFSSRTRRRAGILIHWLCHTVNYCG